jgi:hypothetical protein
MERIIEFLMSNIVIVIIVVGFLLSVFRKKGNGGPPGRMPDFGGGPKPIPRSPRQAPTEDAEGSRNDRTPNDRTVSPFGPPVNSEMSTQRRPLVLSPPARVEPNRVQVNKLEATADDLRKAVMWAEILGPPRAKRPFRRS